MNNAPHMLWLSVSQFLKCFDQRLLARLVKVGPVRRWEYLHTADEPCCIDAMIAALHDHIESRVALEQRSGCPDSKVHLLGHGVSGILALLYARRYPEYIASLTLLSVCETPATNWQAHYYARRLQLPCSREIILAHLVQMLMGSQPLRVTKALSKLLAQDLDGSLTLHSLAHHVHVRSGAVEVPLLICNGQGDPIVGRQQQAWRKWLKAEDELWLCPDGRYFFHFHYAEKTAQIIGRHIKQVTAQQSTGKIHTVNAGSKRPVQLTHQYEGISRLLTQKPIIKSD